MKLVILILVLATCVAISNASQGAQYQRFLGNWKENEDERTGLSDYLWARGKIHINKTIARLGQSRSNAYATRGLGG